MSWMNLKTIKSDPKLLIGIIIFIIASTIEFLFVFVNISSVSPLYVIVSVIWLFLLLFQWPLLLSQFRNDELSVRYKMIYAISIIILIILIYFGLFYPIFFLHNPPSQGEFFSVIPGLFGGITAILTIILLVEKDINAIENTGKSLWSIPDDYVKKREKKMLILLLLILPLIIFVVFPISTIIYLFLDIFKIPKGIRMILGLVPLVIFVLGLVLYSSKLKNEIKEQMTVLLEENRI